MNPKVAVGVALTLIAGAAPAAVESWSVEAMSSERRLPDRVPSDGVKGGAVRILAARGEIESGSFLLRSDRPVSGARLAWGDLASKDGARIPASAVDVRIVKCWYQQGSAWGGYFSDQTRRVLTPELLLHDETLVKVDEKTQEDFIRARFADGTSDYLWLTYLPIDTNFKSGIYRFRPEWVRDTPTLQPFVLEANRFKQFWLTVRVPRGAKAGLYRGEVKLIVEGQGSRGKGQTKEGEFHRLTSDLGPQSCSIPVHIRVLPFELPKPAALRDVKKRFYPSMMAGLETNALLARNPDILSDFADHNLTAPFLGAPRDAHKARAFYAAQLKYGLDTDRVFCQLPSAAFTTSDPVSPTDSAYDRYRVFQLKLTNAYARLRASFGPDTIAYAFGIDEGKAAKVRAERAAWREAHAAGARTIVTTHLNPFILFSLDAVCVPVQPAPARARGADLMHLTDPDRLVSWYSDPHSGPENPDFTRRLYGWQSWRYGYDMTTQWCFFSRGWAEFTRCYEEDLRSLTFAYAAADGFIGTLQWEGYRESVDDIRYATLLNRLAGEARASKDVNVQYLGRAAKTFLAEVPFETSSLKFLRYETVARILRLQTALGKGK